MLRREFLIAASAAALGGVRAGAVVSRDTAANVRVPSAPRLAFQVYAVRDLCARDFPGTLKAVREIGYEGVETGRFYGLDAKGLGAAVRGAGLELVALQLYPHTLTEPNLKETIRFCQDSGCRRINTAWFKGSAENENDWQLVVNVINHAAEVCAREGIAIGYHNHDQEFSIRFDGKAVCEWLSERFSPRVLQEFDPGWCVLGGGDPLAWLASHRRRNPTVHVMPAIADTAGLKPGGAGVAAPRDRADWSRLIPALVRDGVEWFVAKPTSFPDSLADLAASYRTLRGILASGVEDK